MARKGILSFRSNRNLEVEETLKSAFQMFVECNDRRGQAWSLSNLAEYQLHRQNEVGALKSLIQAKSIASDIGECGIDYQELIQRLLEIHTGPKFKKALLEEKDRIWFATMYSADNNL